jgi:16S rRNA (cytosine967-C5)-methyltransferase
MTTDGLAARMAAVGMIGAVLNDGLTLSQIIAMEPGPLDRLSPSDRARAQRLTLAVLRQAEPIDRLLAPRLRKAPPPVVRDVLRLAVAELAMGSAPHGVVNAAVEIVRQGRRTGHLTGVVNAVLRGLPPAPGLLADEAAQKLPRWLRQPLVHAWGREAVTAMEQVQARVPPLDLTLLPGATAHPMGEVLPTGSLRLSDPGQISGLPGYAEGQWWVQDAAAALAVPLLAPRPAERVLDLCAAPGGKTLQLAAAGAEVTALDISQQRMARVAENLARTGLSAQLVVADALEWQPTGGAGFDAILLDAPCSATGTIRRHPDLPFVRDGSDLPDLVALQARLLDRALGWLRPGGRLVFATCSLLPEEGEGQLAAALARHPGLTVTPPRLTGVDEAWITPQGGLRLRPDHWAARGGMDGFFMACLRQG